MQNNRLAHRLDRRRAQGIVLLALLLTMALIDIAFMGALQWWSVALQRENEQELLFIGDQYRTAIERYYYATPGGAKVLPLSMDDLLEDSRFPLPVRHLRRLYPDPMTGAPFALLRVGDQINGVASTSAKQTIKRSGFSAPYGGFEGIETYDQWKFLFIPPRARRASSPLPSSVSPAQSKNRGVKP